MGEYGGEYEWVEEFDCYGRVEWDVVDCGVEEFVYCGE